MAGLPALEAVAAAAAAAAVTAAACYRGARTALGTVMMREAVVHAAHDAAAADDGTTGPKELSHTSCAAVAAAALATAATAASGRTIPGPVKAIAGQVCQLEAGRSAAMRCQAQPQDSIRRNHHQAIWKFIVMNCPIRHVDLQARNRKRVTRVSDG